MHVNCYSQVAYLVIHHQVILEKKEEDSSGHCWRCVGREMYNLIIMSSSSLRDSSLIALKMIFRKDAGFSRVSARTSRLLYAAAAVQQARSSKRCSEASDHFLRLFLPCVVHCKRAANHNRSLLSKARRANATATRRCSDPAHSSGNAGCSLTY